MTVVATSGTASCATISLAWFKVDERGNNWVNNNEGFKKLSEPRQRELIENCHSVLGLFYQDVLYPTSQPLGETCHFPFECIMRTIRGDYYTNKADAFDYEEGVLNTKLITVLLNQQTLQANNYYWVKELTRWGFSLVDATHNEIGQDCFLFIRNKGRVVFGNIGLKTTKAIIKRLEGYYGEQ